VVVELCVVEASLIWKTRFVTAKKFGAKLRADIAPKEAQYFVFSVQRQFRISAGLEYGRCHVMKLRYLIKESIKIL
jgi:hypothetical protein